MLFPPEKEYNGGIRESAIFFSHISLLCSWKERQNWTEQHIFGNVNKQHNGSLSLFRYTFPTMFKFWSVVLCGVKKLAYVFGGQMFLFFAADTDLNLK